MRIHNLYTDADGQSHFRDIEIEWAEERRGSKMSKRLPANGIIFRETQAEHDIDWHPAPRRQYIVNLDAGVKITASDGMSGNAAASTTRSPSTPRTFRSGSSTLSAPRPIAHVPSGWFTVITSSLIHSSMSASVFKSVAGASLSPRNASIGFA